jgi:hypothetical protein
MEKKLSLHWASGDDGIGATLSKIDNPRLTYPGLESGDSSLRRRATRDQQVTIFVSRHGAQGMQGEPLWVA